MKPLKCDMSGGPYIIVRSPDHRFESTHEVDLINEVC